MDLRLMVHLNLWQETAARRLVGAEPEPEASEVQATNTLIGGWWVGGCCAAIPDTAPVQSGPRRGQIIAGGVDLEACGVGQASQILRLPPLPARSRVLCACLQLQQGSPSSPVSSHLRRLLCSHPPLRTAPQPPVRYLTRSAGYRLTWRAPGAAARSRRTVAGDEENTVRAAAVARQRETSFSAARRICTQNSLQVDDRRKP